ncbi:MAG TPA: DUF5916 domain-containing protein [Longimicrobiales bacterium]|nr:DUF5916 domain-containing protein [Longimicrobiales bacterium]
MRRLADGTATGVAAAILSFAGAGGQVEADGTSGAGGSQSGARTLQIGSGTPDIVVDGVLDEAAWADAPAASGFVQNQPRPGEPASQRTEARVLFDGEALYVGVRLFDDDPGAIASQLTRRDQTSGYSDWAGVIIDSYFDRRTAFAFYVNPKGVRRDLYIFNDSDDDEGWDPVWEAAAMVDGEGWSAEMRIPLSQLRFSATAEGQEVRWGINFYREIAREDEESYWSPVLPEEDGFVSRAGTLEGLPRLDPPRRLEIEPYTSASLTRAPGNGANPFYERNDAGASIGADVNWGVTPDLTLSATINPDFGQVEVDPAVVNLSAFETFFPEKRPFFLEGVDIFNSFGSTRTYNNFGGQDVFFSRRIGREPQRGVPDASFADVPAQTTIATAAKLSGKTSGGWSIGVLDAVTLEETASFVDEDGAFGETPVEPTTNYFVGRVRKDVRAGNTVVGGIVTATNRAMDGDLFGPLMHSDAYFGGLDFEHAWNDREWTLSGYVGGSYVRGSEEALLRTQTASARYYQRPDADHVELDSTRTSLSGYVGAFSLAKTGGEHWLASATLREASPGLELNDLGFMSQTDQRAISTLVLYRENDPGRLFREWDIGLFQNWAWTTGNEKRFEGYGFFAEGTLNSFWYVELDGSYSGASYSPFLTRGGPLMEVVPQWNLELEFETDRRKPISFHAGAFYREDEADEYDKVLFGGVLARPGPNVQIRFDPSLVFERDADQFVTARVDPLAASTFGTRYVFADVEGTRLTLNTRVDWTFAPDLSLQLFVQPLISANEFSNYKEFREPRTFDFDVYGEDRGTLTRSDGMLTVDPDGDGPAESFSFGERTFNFRSIRANAVLRWEYRPGSELFIVWQHLRSDSGPEADFDLNRDFDSLFEAEGTNVVVIKGTYWLGL